MIFKLCDQLFLELFFSDFFVVLNEFEVYELENEDEKKEIKVEYIL